MPTNRRFDPDQVARLEAEGWRAYYDRRWLLLLRMVVRLCEQQFHIPFPQSWLAAYYVTRAAAAWAPVDHDLRKVQHFYERFYRMASRYSGLRFDAARVAEIETQYNEVHRRLSGKPDTTEFVDVMVQLHSATFGISPAQARDSAEWRVQANNTVDEITSGRSRDVEADWARIERQLQECYRSILRELDRKPG